MGVRNCVRIKPNDKFVKQNIYFLSETNSEGKIDGEINRKIQNSSRSYKIIEGIV
jgi:hypothetical protein